MKKVFSLLVIFAAVMTANAQIVQFGITGDIAFDKAAGAKEWDKSNFKADMGWSAGVKLKISTPLMFGVDAALKIAQEDRSYSWFMEGDGSTNSANDIIEGKVSYLAVPINLRYDVKLPAISRVAIPYAFVGPEFCYNFKGLDLKDVKIGNASDKYESAKDYFKEQKTQWNLNFGIGVVLARHLELSYVHTVRMTDALDKKSGNAISDNAKKVKELSSRFKNQTNKIALTYYF